MAPRSLGPFIETPGSYGRRPRVLLWAWMLILLAVIFFVIFKVVPQGSGEAYSDRQARRKLAEAEKLEAQALNYFAADIYAGIADSDRVDSGLRVKAARGLARVYRTMPNHDEAVAKALQKAYWFASGPDKEALRDELGHLGEAPRVASAAPAAPASAEAASAGEALPAGARVLARIGDEAVSNEEILYAWRQMYGMREPTPAELKPFASLYLDLALLADAARQQGLDRQPESIYRQRVQRIYGLSQAITEKLVRELKTPDAKTLEEYYKTHLELFTMPARAVIGHIVVGEKDAARVAKALDQGQRFDRVARQYSLDANQLQEGYILGSVAANEAGLPGLGPNPRLVARLMALDDGTTTGPIASTRGQHWFRVISKVPPTPQPFKKIQEEVLFSYQKAQLAKDRSALLQQLRQQRPIEILDPMLGPATQAEAAPTTQTTAAAAPATTTTLTTTSMPAEAPSATPPQEEKEKADESQE